jgi:hypothetical protein
VSFVLLRLGGYADGDRHNACNPVDAIDVFGSEKSKKKLFGFLAILPKLRQLGSGQWKSRPRRLANMWLLLHRV